jgi:hypothetical protein
MEDNNKVHRKEPGAALLPLEEEDRDLTPSPLKQAPDAKEPIFQSEDKNLNERVFALLADVITSSQMNRQETSFESLTSHDMTLTQQSEDICPRKGQDEEEDSVIERELKKIS